MGLKATETGLLVWVPEDRRPVGKCTVITHCTDDGEITYCHTPLYSHREMEQHTAACAARHMDQIRKASLRERMPGFYGPESGIPDVEQWLQRQDTAGDSNRQKVIRGDRKL